MSERERTRQAGDHDPSREPGGDGPESGGLARRRRDVEDLLRAGDDIINRVLDGDSVTFLAAGRQQGGQ